MGYIDGFVIAVPTANKQQFIDNATFTDTLFKELGAVRVIECWGDDVPRRHAHRLPKGCGCEGGRDGGLFLGRVARQGDSQRGQGSDARNDGQRQTV